VRQPPCIANHLAGLATHVPEHRLVRVRKYVDRLFAETLTRRDDGTIFVVTGDIPAMWIRDSTWQMLPLLKMNPDEELIEILGSVSRLQTKFLGIDPYANAFNESASGQCWHQDFPDQSPWVFERKFELDSWSTFFELAISIYEHTGSQEHLDQAFWELAHHILALCAVEQNHQPDSYRFIRRAAPLHDYLSHDGYGAPVGFTGMVWSAFRPSDDRCVYGYHIPSNAHLAATLSRLAKIANEMGLPEIANKSENLSQEISCAISQTLAENSRYPYEVDGLGNSLYMDDPNIPSLLALPILGYCDNSDESYLATREWLLSSEHKFWINKNGFSGLSSEHTPTDWVWPLAIAMAGLTSQDEQEQERSLLQLELGDGGTGDMHESFSCENPKNFTRPWFSWADMTYVSLVLQKFGRNLAR